MVNKLLLVALAFSLSFCDKDNDDLPSNSIPETTFRFTIKGKEYRWNGSLAENSSQGSEFKKRSNPDQNNSYQLWAMGGDTHNFITLELPETFQIEVKTYSFSRSGSNPPYLGEFIIYDDLGTAHSGIKPGDNSNITITKIENGYATGTFNAVLDGFAITNGVFTNVKILK